MQKVFDRCQRGWVRSNVGAVRVVDYKLSHWVGFLVRAGWQQRRGSMGFRLQTAALCRLSSTNGLAEFFDLSHLAHCVLCEKLYPCSCGRYTAPCGSFAVVWRDAHYCSM